MRKDDCFLLGYVIKPHGLKGEVSVLLDTDFPEDYTEMESVFLETDQKLIPFFISSISVSQDRAVIKFEDVDTVEAAAALKGRELYLPDSFLPELDETQFYFHEVIGFEVIDEAHGNIGHVTDIYEAGRQELLAVDHHGTEVLVPLVDEILIKVDRETRTLLVNLPDGLMDIYTEE